MVLPLAGRGFLGMGCIQTQLPVFPVHVLLVQTSKERGMQFPAVPARVAAAFFCRRVGNLQTFVSERMVPQARPDAREVLC
jgi:hypothetical protein